MRGTSLSSILILGLIILTQVSHCLGQLKVGFYEGKCRKTNVENVIYEVVKQKITKDPDIVSDLVRVSFHDCFVRGCEGSILLNGEDVEQKAPINKGLGGTKAVSDIKEAVEKVCPGVVSCTDVLVIGARAAIALAGGKWYEVETGRRDGLVSLKSEAQANIPPPTMPVAQAIELFARKGLNKDDFVVLLGGHTVGTTHCHSFKERLYNFHNTKKPDPTIATSLLQLLQKTCPLNTRKGVLEIDQNLALSHQTRGLVKGLATSPHLFLDQFGPAMVKMARIGVLTGTQGEIRKTCGSVN
ncbi:Cationic peroxidase 2 [Bienertia sinuspersici]